MHVALIHNEAAGGTEPSADALMAAIRAEGHEPRYWSSRPDDVVRALQSPGDLVAVAGGDGTVVDVASRLAGHSVPIAVVPAGTANNIAAFLGIGGFWRSAIAGWVRSTPRFADLGWVIAGGNKLPFVESVGCGLMVDLMIRFDADQSLPEPQSPHEELGQARQKFRELIQKLRPRTYHVSLDDRDFSGRYLMVEAMNLGRLGPGLRLAPEANPCDGLLDVVLITEEDRDRLESHLENPVAADDSAEPPLMAHRARKVIIDAGDERLHVGGEPWPRESLSLELPGPVEITLQKHALSFLVPSTGRILCE